MKAIIVGAGLSGSTAAFLLKRSGFLVEVFDTRSHVAGNCYDFKKEKMFIHQYGPHTFHTNNSNIWKFVNQFDKFKPYCHRVQAKTNEGQIPIPFNKMSSSIVGQKSNEEIVDLIFKNYSQKMWGIDWDQLPSSTKNRTAKIRDSYFDCYHEDKYQGIPQYGYTEMILHMLDGIPVHLNCDKNDWKKQRADLYVFTGKLDDYFNRCYGDLGYRSLDIQFKEGKRQNCYQLNDCTLNVKHTRTIDYSYLNDQILSNGKTVIAKEFPIEHIPEQNIPFYPKNFLKDAEIYKKYIKLAKKEHNVIFLGRLATYKYLDMDIVIGQAISQIKKING